MVRLTFNDIVIADNIRPRMLEKKEDHLPVFFFNDYSCI